MKINKLLIIITLTMLQSCNSQTIDLDKVDFNKKPNFEGFKFSRVEHQKGHFVYNKEKENIDLTGEEESVHYYFNTKEELEQLKFNQFIINDFGAVLAEYNNKLVFAKLVFERDETFRVYNYLEKKFGHPNQTFKRELYNKENPIIKILINNLTEKQGLKKVVDDYDDEYLEYPYENVWVKGNLIYQYTIASAVTGFHNRLRIISKKALDRKIVFGCHAGENDPILGKYIKRK